MPNIDLSILNQRQTPAFYADTLANRPAAGFVGRIFVSTNTFAFYRDNGTGWDLIGGPGTGTITGSGTSGQIALWDGASTITGDTGLTYNGTDNSLTASKFIVTGGTSSQFLKADGSVDSSSYVPYTGATTSLNMGANNISGQNYFINGNNVNSGGFLGIKQFNGSSSGQLGYTSISALTQNSLYFQFSQTNGSNKTFELSAGLLGTSTVRQFQLPDADGTIALTSNIPSVSGAVGQVSYFNGINSITGSNDLFWDSVNGHLGIGTNLPGTALDVKHDQNTVVQLEQVTATNDTRIAFINNGVGLWRLGSFYNAGANDFGLFDIAAATQPVTVKRTTGQVLIGTSTVGSGKLVVASTTGDNGVQIVGASAPSLRIDNAESGPTKRAGLGISTATNNFIQGSADRDFCIFNGSTAAASPILFGIYDAAAVNVQEAARISPARNLLLGTSVDAGQKLQVNGTALITAAANQSISTYIPTSWTGISDYVTNGIGWQFSRPNDGVLAHAIFSFNGTATNNLAISTRSDLVIATGGGLGLATETIRFNASSLITFKGSSTVANGAAIFENNNTQLNIFGTEGGGTTKDIKLQSGGSATAPRVTLKAGGNFLIGTDTDNGTKLQVNGAAEFSGSIVNNTLPTSGNYTIDTVPSGGVVIAGLGAINISSFSGMILITNLRNGVTMLFLCGGGAGVLISQSTAGATGTLTNFGGSGYTFTTADALSATYIFQLFRTRNLA